MGTMGILRNVLYWLTVPINYNIVSLNCAITELECMNLMDQVVAQNAVPSNDNTATSTSDVIFLTPQIFYYIISRKIYRGKLI